MRTKRLAATLGAIGALSMAIALQTGALRTPLLTLDYPGWLAARWFVEHAPAKGEFGVRWLFNASMILSSALEWIVAGVGLRIMFKIFRLLARWLDAERAPAALAKR